MIIDDFVDFLFEHPFLSSAALLNLYAYAFIPEVLATTALATAAVFTLYSVFWIVSSLIKWIGSNDNQPPSPAPQREWEDDHHYNHPHQPHLNAGYMPPYHGSDHFPSPTGRSTYDGNNNAYSGARVASAQRQKPFKHYKGGLTLEGFETAIGEATTSNISYEPLTAVIADDLFLHDQGDLIAMQDHHSKLLARQAEKIAANFDFIKAREEMLGLFITSPCSSKPIDVEHFLFNFVKFTQFCKNNTDISLLVQAATCPITNKIMDAPVVVHLKTQNYWDPVSFVLVCDRSALASLGRRFELVHTQECIRLSGLLQAKHPQSGVSLHSILSDVHAELHSCMDEVSPYDRWPEAQTIARRNFPATQLNTVLTFDNGDEDDEDHRSRYARY